MLHLILGIAYAVLQFSTTVHARQEVMMSVCNNQVCQQGFMCKCECGQTGLTGGTIYLYGCGACSPSLCANYIPEHCGQVVKKAYCQSNCQNKVLEDDNECHALNELSPERPSWYKLTTDGRMYDISLYPDENCTSQFLNSSFQGDGRNCYYIEDRNWSFRVNPKYGMSTGGIIGIVLAILLSIGACCWCASQEEYIESASRRLPPNKHKRGRSSAASVTAEMTSIKTDLADDDDVAADDFKSPAK